MVNYLGIIAKFWELLPDCQVNLTGLIRPIYVNVCWYFSSWHFLLMDESYMAFQVGALPSIVSYNVCSCIWHWSNAWNADLTLKFPLCSLQENICWGTELGHNPRWVNVAFTDRSPYFTIDHPIGTYVQYWLIYLYWLSTWDNIPLKSAHTSGLWYWSLARIKHLYPKSDLVMRSIHHCFLHHFFPVMFT